MMSCLSYRTRIFIKLFMFILVVYFLFLIFMYQDRLYNIQIYRRNVSSSNGKKFKYILQWSDKSSSGFEYLEVKDAVFKKYNCKYQNCFITDNREYLSNLKDFDAIIFNGIETNKWQNDLPKVRSPKQKYIFASLESPDFYPACNKYLDGYFNWTWTYKISSDVQWSYITVYDKYYSLMGPEYGIQWEENMKSIDATLKRKLDKKKKAVAWFVSNCWSKSKREIVVGELRDELAKFGWTVDVFGKCGNLSCPRHEKDVCFKMIEDDYKFYLSFENSFAEDYVSEKLLIALNNYAVPIVYGGADYSRLHGKHWCGGAIVGKQWVLTAAQCFDYVSKEEVTIRMGSVFRDFGGRILSITEIKRHPDYRTDQYYPEHNLAMIKTNIPIMLTNRVQVVSVAAPGSELPGLFGETIITGFGSVVTGQIREGENQELRRMIVKEIPRGNCRKLYGNDYRLQHDHMCLESVMKGVALCAGDTGDPAVHFSGINRAGTLFGIALFSGTEECALKSKPGVYAKVSYSKTWIDKILNDQDVNESADSGENLIPVDY